MKILARTLERHGTAATGTWQQIVLLDFDHRPRQRKVILQISGS